MISNKKLAVAVSGAVLLMAGQIALADSTTDIVDALVSKGVLTEEEGKLISKGHETKKKAEGTVTFKDGFKINSGDGKSSISINGRIQADYRSFDKPETAGNANTGADNANTFDLRRTYLTAKGNYRNTSFEATYNGTGSTGAVAIKYYWLEYKFSDAAKLRFGQFKTPMGLETLTSSRFNDFTERDFTSALQASINKGIMLHGVPMAGVTYAAMVSNGAQKYEAGETAIETSNNMDGKSYTGRLTANIAEMIGNKEAIMHVGGSYGYDGNLATGSYDLVSMRTNARGLTFFKGGTTEAGTLFSNGLNMTRYGLEGIGAYGPVKVQAEFVNAEFDSKTAGVADRDMEAYYVGASWMITGEKFADSYKNGLFDRMSPKNNFTGFNGEAGSGWGAWELGLRYSHFDATDFGTAASGFTNKADSYTAGVKWIADPNTRFLLNYIYSDFGSPVSGGLTTRPTTVGNEKAINFRAQFDF